MFLWKFVMVWNQTFPSCAADIEGNSKSTTVTTIGISPGFML